MRSSAGLQRRLGRIAALQALRATAGRGELAEAAALRAEAGSALAERYDALAAGASAMEAVLASEALDFDRWRIGRALLDTLAVEHDEAARILSDREREEDEARTALARETACAEHAHAVHIKHTRKLHEKRETATTLETNGLKIVRKVLDQ